MQIESLIFTYICTHAHTGEILVMYSVHISMSNLLCEINNTGKRKFIAWVIHVVICHTHSEHHHGRLSWNVMSILKGSTDEAADSQLSEKHNSHAYTESRTDALASKVLLQLRRGGE